MKYLLIILSLLSFSFSQLLPSDEDIAKMSSFEKQILYEKNDKSPTLATILNFTPTLGYAYIDDWKRGVYFKVAELTSFCVGHYLWETGVGKNAKDKSRLQTLGFIGYSVYFGLRVYEHVDIYKQTNKYNKQLHNKIFQKDNNFSFLILPTSDGAYLNLSYKF